MTLREALPSAVGPALFHDAHPTWLEAEYYDTDLLTIFSKILPRVVTMSSLDPAIGAPIAICIVREDIDAAAARRFEALLKQNNAHHGDGHALQTVDTNFARLTECGKSQLIFMFDTRPDNQRQTVLAAQAQGAMIASYSTEMLREGSDISLFVGRSVMPYLNLRTLHEKNISVDTLLLRVSKIYRETDTP